MKNQYVGDIGDYGKYGLLRFLSKHGILVGVNWYLTKDDKSSDGKFVEYLEKNDQGDKDCDSELFEELQKIALPNDRQDKSVEMIENAGLIPGSSYYHKRLRSSDIKAADREAARREWFKDSLNSFPYSDLVFADPDNGITFTKTARAKESEKYVLPEEIVKYYAQGKEVVFYCHKGRRKDDAWMKSKNQIRECIKKETGEDAQILGLTFHRGTQRSYIFVVHPEHYGRYVDLINKFIKTSWRSMFTKEPMEGNIMTSEEEENLISLD